ncbi:MAG: ATP phosphoribosyltransferase regulatory subunit, partial [Planctomycetes bacterium]|nr:ATP phosphoribosyltransferase regulatory subunit [Planctomycetota bacterium]
ARMVNQQINSLPRPIKWFSVPRLCRAERPQKGRLREFFQWNVDIIGANGVLADAEVIFTTIDYLRGLGLKPGDIKAKISSRSLLAEFLKAVGISESKLEALYPILDKKSKIPAEAFKEMLDQQVDDAAAIGKIIEFMSLEVPGEIGRLLDGHPEETGPFEHAVSEIKKLFEMLGWMGVKDYCVFDPGIVRGLAYYTGPVFEVHDAVGDLRAICGGGRYDNLLRDFGGPAVSGTGMGMGDCVLEILLREKGLLTDDVAGRSVDYFVVSAGPDLAQNAIEITARLRKEGFGAEFSYKSGNLGKQLKQASDAGAVRAVIVGEEFTNGNQLVIKDMSAGTQESVDAEKFFQNL